MQMNQQEIIAHLKRGRASVVEQAYLSEKKSVYPDNFCAFMDILIQEKKIKRTIIASRSGLDRDYLYKLLRGDKKTGERDYIIAICLALECTVSQTQHALSINGMDILDKRDLRDQIILIGIEEKKNRDDVNEMLEKNQYCLLKTDPSMPTAERNLIIDTLDTVSHEETKLGAVENDYGELTEVDRTIGADPCGNAPVDYAFWGKITVQDENGVKYYVEASFSPFGEIYLVMDEKGHELAYGEEECLPGECSIEFYETLSAAVQSQFWPWFSEIDRETDKKVIEILEKLDDTRNYDEGIRVGAGFHGGEKCLYIEAFDMGHPEERRYLQIRQTDGKYTYSMSHESYFMRYEMDAFYPAYFYKRREPEYVFEVYSEEQLKEQGIPAYHQMMNLQVLMHKYAEFAFPGISFVDSKELETEAINVTAQQATTLLMAGKFEESLEKNKELLSLLDTNKGKMNFRDELMTRVTTFAKIAQLYALMGDSSRGQIWEEKIIEYEEDIFAIAESGNKECSYGVVPALCNSYLRRARDYKDVDALFKLVRLVEGRFDDEANQTTLFLAYINIAAAIDGEEPEKANEYSEKAMNIVSRFELDRVPELQMVIVTMYNNYAWVLWNKLGDIQSIMYYGRALELLEGYMLRGEQPVEKVKAELAHIGKALYSLYKGINKDKEAEKLLLRLEKNDVNI